ncbi:putative hydrolase or acyltransferase of alpha/beta superfamily [Mycolicibacterium rhodesiae NBB3]|uniref:Putative hydrolase or acyltransferase of alpha/beta superfamily n=1 Tax=Mycolicibacterium rhodesiae (strain NBB3) TaxID=710685 RepID=G8RIN7_MYCRN|nr:alpha/beta fold hydrolase [Mycolicibacterium rhodesiae]AEV75944.1 putative hydrolase or acyltransferase of alpha/beta superfamily [Mycolicibacterium rhodesiae NBB3]
MIVPRPDFVSTDLGRLHVRRSGTGPPVVLWHSLFVDSQSWGPLVDELARDRTVYAIDGPSHGKSESVLRDFTFDEVVTAAEQALDRLGLVEPVDWVGNAWGGHVGIRLATGSRLRTLTTIGTPVQGFNVRERVTKGWPLVAMYRLMGGSGLVGKLLAESLIGVDSIAAQPEQAETTMAAFRNADRNGMYHAMRSMMLHRAGVASLLPSITVPTLVMSVRDDAVGWQPDEARQTCAAIPNCQVEQVEGGGHVAPLLVDRERVLRLLTDFWARTDHDHAAK